MNYRRRIRSLLLYLCYVFRALINSLACWIWCGTVHCGPIRRVNDINAPLRCFNYWRGFDFRIKNGCFSSSILAYIWTVCVCSVSVELVPHGRGLDVKRPCVCFSTLLKFVYSLSLLCVALYCVFREQIISPKLHRFPNLFLQLRLLLASSNENIVKNMFICLYEAFMLRGMHFTSLMQVHCCLLASFFKYRTGMHHEMVFNTPAPLDKGQWTENE